MSEQWLSIIEYARRYNISDMTVRRRIKTGRIKAILRDGKYFIPVGEYIEHHNAGVESEEESYSTGHWNNNMMRDRGKRPEHMANSHLRSYSKDNIAYSTPEPSSKPETISSNYESILEEIKTEIRSLREDIKIVVEEFRQSKADIAQRFDAENEVLNQKIENCNIKISEKDILNKQLNQQVEDLQLLINMLEEEKQTN